MSAVALCYVAAHVSVFLCRCERLNQFEKMYSTNQKQRQANFSLVNGENVAHESTNLEVSNDGSSLNQQQFTAGNILGINLED